MLAREGSDARDLRARQRPARIPSAARLPRAEAQAHRRHLLRCRRNPHHLRLAAGDRSRQRHPAGARRHRHHRAGDLSGRADAAGAARRQGGRHPARRARACASDALAAALDDLKRRGVRPKYIYTIPTVQNPTGTIMSEARRRELLRLAADARRADLRGRLLRRSHLGRPAAAGALRHEQARRRHPYRLVLQVDRAGAARRLHRRRVGRCSRACSRSRPTPAPARSSRWCSANFAPRISTRTCRG